MSDPTPPQTSAPVWERWLPRLSGGAAIVTTLCCIGLSAVISLATAVGATFMTRDSSLRPILAVTLIITAIASAFTLRRHRNPLPLIITIASGALIFWTLFGGSNASGHGSTGQDAGTAHSTTAPGHTDEHAATPTSSHDAHATGTHGDEPHATTAEHAAEHSTTPGAAQDDHGDTTGHGSSINKPLIWLGIIALTGAQVWDLLLLRSRRRTPAPA